MNTIIDGNSKRSNITTNTMKNRSQSFSSFQLLESPTTSITSSSSAYSLHNNHNIPRSCRTDFSTTSSSSNSNSRRFHSSHLGRPPGNTTTNSNSNRVLHKPPMFSSSSSSTTTTTTTTTKNSHNAPKIAPLKEVEKMITDLKKENFDLKLRLYHLEDMMTKDMDMYQLKQENRKLRMDLEDRSKHMEGLEQELASLLESHRNTVVPPISSCSIGIQTDDDSYLMTPITPTSTIDTFHTAFESSPEAFGLLPVSKSLNSISRQVTYNKTKGESWQRIVANEDHMSSVVSALQKVKIDNNSNIVECWLNQNVNDHQQGNLSHPIS